LTCLRHFLAMLVAAIWYICANFGVDSSCHFLFRVWAYRHTESATAGIDDNENKIVSSLEQFLLQSTKQWRICFCRIYTIHRSVSDCCQSQITFLCFFHILLAAIFWCLINRCVPRSVDGYPIMGFHLWLSPVQFIYNNAF